MTSTAPLLLSPADIAHLIGRPKSTVTRWASEGRLTSHDGRYDYREVSDVHKGLTKRPPRRPTLAGV